MSGKGRTSADKGRAFYIKETNRPTFQKVRVCVLQTHWREIGGGGMLNSTINSVYFLPVNGES